LNAIVKKIIEFLVPEYKEQSNSIEKLFTLIGLKEDIQDVVDIDYSKIHSGNIVDMLYRFTNILLITQYKDKLYIVYEEGTILFYIDHMEIYGTIKDKLIVVNKEGFEFTIPFKNRIEIDIIQGDDIIVNGIQYNVLRLDDKVYFFTTLSTQLKSFVIDKDKFDFVRDVKLIEHMGSVFIVVSGIRGDKHIKIYYTIDKFNPVHYKITDSFGNVTFSGAYLPKS
jgi:hypothetical protein